MSILSALVFLILISSGSVFCSSYFNKRYEEILPISCAGIVLISFLFGLIGLLKYSTILICLICIVLIVLGIIKAIKDKNIKGLLLNTFTPGFVVFVVLVMIMILGVYGKVFDTTDEFSHWGDIVKVMTLLDDFGTNPLSHSAFKTYPPGMSLFQYTLVEINTFISKESFSEWLCYLGYDIFSIALLVPICSNMKFKKALSPIAVLLTVFLMPFGFYAYSYFSVYIDEFLGILIAAGMITLLWDKNNDVWFVLKIGSIISMLVLAKDAGLLFAALFAVAAILKIALNNKNNIFGKDNIIKAVSIIAFVALPKVLWSLNVKARNAASVFNKVDIASLINVLLGKEDSYRPKVLKNFITQMVTGAKFVGYSQIAVNYVCLTVISIFVAYLLISTLLRKKKVNEVNAKITFFYFSISLIVYIIGLCVIYMYSFNENEALGLASFSRYIYIAFLGEWLFIILSLIRFGDEEENIRRALCGFAICFAFFTSNLEAAVTFVSNAYAKASVALRANYTDVIEKTLKYVDGDDQIWFIQQETFGDDGQQINFGIRPNYINGYPSIGQYEDDDDKDITIPMTPEEWREKLVNDKYDYVLLYEVNGTFRNYFASCFEEDSDIEERTLWKVDKQTGMLSLCE